ncbi:LPXTG cell wall anchor domain-containing protein [Enterococcus hirae]|uniref:LPXTG cell wall anchor domain-containing protein n=1 Tax=Enterococcus hirae TaxID=1354 RepID=UPI003982A069
MNNKIIKIFTTLFMSFTFFSSTIVFAEADSSTTQTPVTVTLRRLMQSGNLPGINTNKPNNTIKISRQKENNILPQTGEIANYLLLLLGLIILIFVTYFYNKTNKWREM